MRERRERERVRREMRAKRGYEREREGCFIHHPSVDDSQPE